MARHRALVFVIAAVLLGGATGAPAFAQLDQLWRGLPSTSPGTTLGDAKIADGLKQALRIGTENAVGATGKLDGYFKNAAIKILMPERLRSVEGVLRAMGQGAQVDEFILSMNRAAERAAPAAKRIFWDAIVAMSFDDAARILRGSGTAATEYFREKTTDRLTAAFAPTVSAAMNEVGVTRQYKQLVGYAQALPFGGAEAFDIDRYVVGKALDGLFHVVGEEEQKIRADPAARVTPLLREVFCR
jgi:hypothetical protein